MPYIKKNKRADLASGFYAPGDAGELNFVISNICNEYLDTPDDPKLNYSKLNEIVGVLECAKLEFYRRIAAPYEDQKIKENGEVYTCNV